MSAFTLLKLRVHNSMASRGRRDESIGMSVDVQLCEDSTPIFTTVLIDDGQRVIVPLGDNQGSRCLTLVLEAEVVRTRQDLAAIMARKKQEVQR